MPWEIEQILCAKTYYETNPFKIFQAKYRESSISSNFQIGEEH